MKHDPVLSTIAKLFSPVMVLLAFYIQFNGEYTPGGGFQSGALLATWQALLAFVFGNEFALNIISMRWIKICASSGVMIYAGTGVACMLMGGNFLEYSVLLHNATSGQHLGIFLVECGVGISVYGSTAMIFFSLYKEN